MVILKKNKPEGIKMQKDILRHIRVENLKTNQQKVVKYKACNNILINGGKQRSKFNCPNQPIPGFSVVCPYLTVHVSRKLQCVNATRPMFTTREEIK